MQELKKKLNSILLVDDDDVTIFYNTHIINKLDITEHVHAELNGEEALKYLMQKKVEESTYVKPDLILLDINMPIMDGFQFLAEYEKLPEEAKSRHMIVMLTSSLLDVDRNRAAQFGCVSAYYPKPLKAEAIQEILEKCFAEHLD